MAIPHGKKVFSYFQKFFKQRGYLRKNTQLPVFSFGIR